MSRRDDLFELVRQVPPGRVMSYGEAGRSLHPPVSGLVAGKWMDQVPSGCSIPWWRIVGADGSLKIARKSPELALEQRRRLEEEGVEFVDDLVRPDFFDWERGD